MIRFTTGNVLQADAEALVNTVNCVGVMGRGVALQFKKAYPDNFQDYAVACKRGDVQPGRMLVHETGQLTNPRYIINFPTKRHWRGKSRIVDILAGLQTLAEEIRSRGIRSVAMPPLGSGLGGLKWSDVRRLIEDELSDLEGVDILVFEPSDVPADTQPNRSRNVPAMTPGRASLIGLMRRYLVALMDPSVTLLEVHKLMYLLQEAGEPLRLRYVKGLYGPYSENLRHVLLAIEGHYVSGYGHEGDVPHRELELVPGAVQDADEFLVTHPETRARFDRVASFVEGFETPFGLELLTTVHWVATREGATEAQEIEQVTYEWGPRKRHFTPTQIGLAVERMRAEGWLHSSSSA